MAATLPGRPPGTRLPERRRQRRAAQNILHRVWGPLQRECGLLDEARSAASLFIGFLKWDPKKVQETMGHPSIVVTYDRYGHLFTDRESEAGGCLLPGT